MASANLPLITATLWKAAARICSSRSMANRMNQAGGTIAILITPFLAAHFLRRVNFALRFSNLASLHRRNFAPLMESRGNQSFHGHIQSACQNHQFPIRDVAVSRFDLGQNLPAQIPAQNPAFCGEHGLRKPGVIAKTADGRPNNVFRGGHRLPLCQRPRGAPLWCHNEIILTAIPPLWPHHNGLSHFLRAQ